MDKLNYEEIARPGLPTWLARVVDSDWFQHSITAVIIANMIGTGVFTSLGFQLLEIRSGFALLALWVVGGITADGERLDGVLAYDPATDAWVPRAPMPTARVTTATVE